MEPSDYANNTYLDSPPTDNHVVVRPNRYEPGRAHIIVYNWEGLGEVSVDLSELMPEGTEYSLYNAQNYFSSPVVSGTYEGGDVAIPLTGLEPALPIGDAEAIGAEQRTGKDFNVFVLRAAVCDS